MLRSALKDSNQILKRRIHVDPTVRMSQLPLLNTQDALTPRMLRRSSPKMDLRNSLDTHKRKRSRQRRAKSSL